MRQNLLTKVRFSKTSVALALLAAAFGMASCAKDDPNAERKDYIKVYSSLDKDARDTTVFSVSVKADTTEFYVRTNVDPKKISVEWQDADNTPWAKVVDVQDRGDGLMSVRLSAKARSSFGYYTRRSGMLMICAPEENLGCYLTIHQGSVARYSNDCSTFKYGSKSPLLADGEVIYSRWTTPQKSYFSTTPFGDSDVAYTFGRNGCIKLGDDQGHGADLITPFVDALRADSLLMVNFRAVAYSDRSVKDNNHFTVEILGGGVFRDFEGQEVKKMEFDAPYYDVADAEFPDHIWNDSEYMLFVCSSKLNPITANTRVKITAGSLDSVSEKNSRLLVSRVYIRRLDPKSDWDYYTENGGSGIDRINGLTADSEDENQ